MLGMGTVTTYLHKDDTYEHEQPKIKNTRGRGERKEQKKKSGEDTKKGMDEGHEEAGEGPYLGKAWYGGEFGTLIPLSLGVFKDGNKCAF